MAKVVQFCHASEPIRTKGQFPVSGIFRAGGILDNKKLLSRNYPFNFRATFSLANKRISDCSENSSDWKSALTHYCGRYAILCLIWWIHHIQRWGSFVALFARLEVHLHFALLLLVSQGYKVDLEEKGPKFPAEVGILRLTTDHSSWLAANPGRGNILKVFDTIVVGCRCTDL